MHIRLTIATLAVSATATFAHVGVKNDAVMERMDNMKDSAAALEVLGKMDKSQMPFDADRAAEAKASLAKLSADVPSLFEAPETDPLSEALPTIWEEWDAFVAKSVAAERAIAGLDVSSQETLGSGLRTVAQACSACHEDYRVKK